MALGGDYSFGTVSVQEGSKAVSSTGALWSDVLDGDWLIVSGTVAVIDSVNSSFNAITLKDNWPGTTMVGATYRIMKMSALRYDPSLTQAQIRAFIADIEAAGLFRFVDGDAPDDSQGEDGQWAFKVNALPWKVWYKQSGTWVSQGSPSGVTWRGAWSGITAYAVGDAVTRLGSSYTAILPGTNKPPESSPTYWQLIAQSGGRYDLMAWASDRPASAEQILSAAIPTPVTFNAGLAQSIAPAIVPATAQAVFSLQKNNSEFGTIAFAGTFPNLIGYSHNLANSIWARVNLDPSATMLGSNGIDTLNKLVPDNVNVRHTLAQSLKVTAQAYTVSAEIYPGESSWVGLSFGQGANVDGAYFNASTGAIGATAAGTTAAITSLGSGHYRASITRTLSAGTASVQIEPHSANSQTTFVGNGINGVFAGFIQFEAAGAASTYIATVLPGTVGVFAAAADTAFAAGDVFGVVTPSPRDATLAGITITVTGFR